MRKPVLAIFVLIAAVAAIPALVVAQACSGGACQQGVARSSEAVSSSGGTSVPAYYTTTVTNGSLPGSSTTTTIASMTVPPGVYVIQFTAEIAVAGESGTVVLDRCRILADGSVVNSQQTLSTVNRGGDLALLAVATVSTGVITVTVRNTSIVAGTANTVNLAATRVGSVTVL